MIKFKKFSKYKIFIYFEQTFLSKQGIFCQYSQNLVFNESFLSCFKLNVILFYGLFKFYLLDGRPWNRNLSWASIVIGILKKISKINTLDTLQSHTVIANLSLFKTKDIYMLKLKLDFQKRNFWWSMLLLRNFFNFFNVFLIAFLVITKCLNANKFYMRQLQVLV